MVYRVNLLHCRMTKCRGTRPVFDRVLMPTRCQRKGLLRPLLNRINKRVLRLTVPRCQGGAKVVPGGQCQVSGPLYKKALALVALA